MLVMTRYASRKASIVSVTSTHPVGLLPAGFSILQHLRRAIKALLCLIGRAANEDERWSSKFGIWVAMMACPAASRGFSLKKGQPAISSPPCGKYNASVCVSLAPASVDLPSAAIWSATAWADLLSIPIIYVRIKRRLISRRRAGSLRRRCCSRNAQNRLQRCGCRPVARRRRRGARAGGRRDARN